MDSTRVIVEFLKMFWLLIPCILLVKILKSRWFKGMMGELRVNCTLRFRLDKNIYHLFTNITLPTTDGSTQIDHVIVSKYGIFVLETKNMQGWISGSKKEHTWTQSIGMHARSFQNPLHQNYKHTKTLQELLDIQTSSIFSLIVFVGKSNFSTAMPKNVVQGGDYIRWIKAKKKNILTEKKIKDIVSDIEGARLKNTFRNRRKHIRHVKHIAEARPLIKEQPCPVCGLPMVLREV
ncbi:MAG: NERD domain-containing protein, partial [Candidatus Electrothrix sp. AR3]|nr:NERD domain-containing protein [Candidatus Electrothrix sp. AR3]